MASTWRNLLTDGSPISKLADVDETGAANGDLLIWNATTSSFKTNVLTGSSGEIDITNTAGNIEIGLPTNVDVDGSLTIGGGAGTTGATISSAGAITCDADIAVNAATGADAKLTLTGGATDKDAIINMYADAGATTLEKWEIKVANGGVMSFNNAAQAEIDQAKFTPHATATSSKLELAGQLHVGGNLIKIGGDSTIAYDSNNLTITESLVTISDELLANVSVTAPLVKGSTSVQTPLIEYTDGDDAITIANGGGITAAAGITSTAAANAFGTSDFNDADITSVGNIELDSLTTAGTDILVDCGGDIILDAGGGDVMLKDDGTQYGRLENSSGELVIKSGTVTMLTGDGADATIAGNATVTGALSVTGNNVTFGNGCTIANGDADTLTITEGTVKIAGNLQVDGTQTVINTETLTVDDNAIVLNDNWAEDTVPTQDAGIIVYRGTGTGSQPAKAIFFKETQPNDDSTSAITQRDSDRWALGGNQSAFTHNFGDFEGFLVTCNVPSTNSNPVDDDNMGSGVGSMWVNPTTEGIYVRVV